LRNVLSLVLNSVVVSHHSFLRDLYHLSHLLVFDVRSLVGNISFLNYRYLTRFYSLL
jgi:hypothetical protein